MRTLIFESDWLASKPFFYNTKTARASASINDVIDNDDVEIDPEGFGNYLDFGYSVFEQTPVRHVHFLRHSTRLWRNSTGSLEVEYLADPVAHWIDFRLSENDIIDLLQTRVHVWEKRVEKNIVVPTSGGYDSRLLNWCIGNKERVRAFTYGVSDDQTQSFEVVYAREVAERLGITWTHIPLGRYHRYLDDWINLYGVSTHAHGMYHFEFYDLINAQIGRNLPLLSGIVGDAWAGSLTLPAVRRPNSLCKLGLTHGMRADAKASKLARPSFLRRKYLHENKDLLCTESGRIISLVRFKMILLSYLLRVPDLFGYSAWSPFLDIDLCMAMLNLPPKRRQGRLWQKDFFKKVGLDVERSVLSDNRCNSLNMQALRQMKVPMLNPDVLAKLLQRGYADSINARLAQCEFRQNTGVIGQRVPPKLHAAMHRLGFRNRRERLLEAYFAFLVLYPIQQLLCHSNQKIPAAGNQALHREEA